MEFLDNIIKIQNLKLLEMMAKDNFIQEKNKREFIDRYNKLNYRLL